MKAVYITVALCLLVAFLFTAGEPDLLDSIQIRLLTADAPGFCQQMLPPVAGINP